MDLVIGPLPKLHRLLVIATALAVGLLSGFLLVAATGPTFGVAAGIGWGLLAGLMLNYVLLHDFHHDLHHTARPVRVRRD